MMGDLADRLVSWIREQVKESGAKGVVVGLSGGIDSSTTAVLCKKAFPEDSLGLVLPCRSNPQDLADAHTVADKFHLDHRTVILDEVFDALVELYRGAGAPVTEDVVPRANLKPRLRMLTLYYFANTLDYLVVGGGNKSELSVGYFTKYGDGGVDILPLGSLLKIQVVELARELGVPDGIIEKPPSAGLWEGQTDEDEMGVTYQVLDKYLRTGEVPPAAKKRIDEMIAASAHKRNIPPVPPF